MQLRCMLGPGPLSGGSAANRVAVVHVTAQVRHVVYDAGAQAQVAHAVVAGGVLAAFIAQPNNGGPRVEGQHPHLQLTGKRNWVRPL